MGSQSLNPIIKADFPDPDVIRVGDTYYMLCSTKHFRPGGEILKSNDLVNWEIVDYVFDKLENTPSERLQGEQSQYGYGMDGCCLRYNNGKFYAVFSCQKSDTTYIFVSENPQGPWEKKTISKTFFNNSLLFDDDGKVYMAYGYRTIIIQELQEDLSGVKEDGLNIEAIHDTADTYLAYCGTHFQKINGRYYLLVMNWPKDTGIRTQYCFSCDMIDGEYTGGKIFGNDIGYHYQGVAQGCFIDTPEGDWYAVMFQDRGAVGRCPVILPVKFEKGAPAIVKNAKLLKPVAGLKNNENKCEPIFCSDKFECIKDSKNKFVLKKQWQWNHVPTDYLWWINDKGGLCIKTGKISTNLIHAQNTLTQRCVYPGSTVEVTLNASLIREGDNAGICVLQGCYGFIGVTKELNQYYLVVISRELKDSPMRDDMPDYLPGTLQERIPLKTSKVTLRIKTNFEDMEDTAEFSYKPEGATHFECIAKKHQLYYKVDHFTGARYGLSIFSTKTTGGFATFTDFKYKI